LIELVAELHALDGPVGVCGVLRRHGESPKARPNGTRIFPQAYYGLVVPILTMGKPFRRRSSERRDPIAASGKFPAVAGRFCEALLAPASGAGEAARLLGGAKQGLGLVDAFLLLEFRIGIGDHAGAGLYIHGA